VKLSTMIAGFITAGCVLSGHTVQAASALNAAQTKQVQKIVQDYISSNPEAVIQSLQSYQQKQMAKSVEKTQAGSVAQADSIFHQSSDPMAGNAKGKVTVVEFFDYQCGHCISMHPVLDNLVKNNPDVRVVFKEFPIRGPASELAARVALAAAMQDKYLPVHEALMKAAEKGPLTDEIVYAQADVAGIDLKKLKEDAKSEAVTQMLKNNFELGQQLGLMGTPAIFVASSSVDAKSPASAIVFIPGETDEGHLNQVIAQVSK